MSDTQTTLKLPPLPNYSLRRVGNQPEQMIVTFGDPVRTVTVKPLDLGDQWDLAELTGANAGNEAWTNMAQVAASVLDFDGVPVMPPRFDRDSLRRVLNKLGLDGLRAVSMALGGVTEQQPGGTALQPAADDTAKLATAGN